ncbi:MULTISPECIES: hypothetical protein [Pseudomonas]|uniref:hypothetical protein n=1 Tax=Pseudomonas TaxID=286 RepID=UPI00044FF91F|nr:MULTISPECIES: hypothetical protein [Pseudomonas]EZP66911.1 hypothetical protein BW43_02082 [Pseudomonas sp. RIT357]MBA2927507.1 hypothetical protein [Pseudomonas sivasensis]
MSTKESATPISGEKTRAPAEMIIGGIAEPQRVKRGEDFKLTIAAQLVDERGTAIPNVTTTWSTSTSGASFASGPGPLNGTLTVRNVQSTTNVSFIVSTAQYPDIKKTHSFTLIPF